MRDIIRTTPPSADDGTDREILPTNVRPTHYELSFDPDLVETFQFRGSVIIDLDVVEKTSAISLNAADLEILDTQIVTGDGEVVEITDLKSDKSKEVTTITLKESVSASSKLKLTQTFTGNLLHRGQGFFRSPFKNSNGKTEWMASTQFEAVGARKAFPCFDEPALKATFSVTLIADQRLTCLGNMDVSSQQTVVTPDGQEKLATTYNNTPLMSTYLVAFAVGDFKWVETSAFRVPIRVYASAEKDLSQGHQALITAARCLESFEKTFDIAFPLPKVDMIAVPASMGAMENWGLVTYAEKLLLLDPDDSSAFDKQSAASVIVHELAHQWFGNIVTTKFWDGLWLNEGFADWAETHEWQTLEPEWEMWQGFLAKGYQLALALDSNRGSHPIEVPVKKASDMNQIFDDISYNKGCSVIRMISDFLGEGIFVKGVQKYLKEHAYGNAITEDLWKSLSQVSGKDVGKIMRTWTTTVGYPVIKVTEDEKSGSLLLTQHRFLQDGTASSEDDTILYPTFPRLRTKEGVDTKTALYDRSIRIKSPLDFYKVNADQVGFYRVSYSQKRLAILSQNIIDGLLSIEDRIGLVSDVFALASSGYGGAKTTTALELLEGLDTESSYFVWIQMIASISSVLETWTFASESMVASLQAYKKRLVHKCLMEKGWDFSDDDDDDINEQLFKTLLFANAEDEPEVKKAASFMFGKFIWGDKKAINPNLREAVFANVLRNGGVKEYNACVSLLSDTANVAQYFSIIHTIGSVRDPDLIWRVLELSTSDEILNRNQTISMLVPLSKHRRGKEALWKWFKKEYDKMQEMFGTGLGLLARVVEFVVAGLSTREQWEDANRFFEGKDTKAYNSYLAQALNTVLAKVNWAERDGESVEIWLRENGYGK